MNILNFGHTVCKIIFFLFAAKPKLHHHCLSICSADTWHPCVGDFRVLQLRGGAHCGVTNDDVAWKVNMFQHLHGEHRLKAVCFTVRKSKQQLSSSSSPPSSSSVCIYMAAWLPANKRRQRSTAATLWEPNPYLQTSGLIKQTECREGVNSCLITNESNDNNNHVPFRLT